MLRLWLAVLLLPIAGLTGREQTPSRPATTTPDPAGGDAALRARIPPRRPFVHAAEIVSDYLPAAGYTRVWIRGGEDDLRLWSPNGRQMEMDFHAWYLVRGPRADELPPVVQFSFETHGETQPGPAPLALALVADGRPVPLRETPEPLARSGALVFYTTRASLGVGDFLTIANASRVEGRCWGHAFVLNAAQLEILRDLASRLSRPSGP